MSAPDKVKPIENNFSKDRQADINYVLRYTRFFLSCIGIWPLVSSNSTKIEKAASKFVIPYCSVTMCLLILPISLHLTMRDVGTTETILLLGPFCHSSTDIIEHFILIFHCDLIKYCVQQMENDWREIESPNDREIAMQNIKIGRSMSFMCAFGMYSSGIFYVVLMPLCSGNTVNELNETVRPLIYPGNDIMIDLQAGYNYEIVFCNNCIATFIHFTVVNAIFNLASIFVTHACGQMQIIMSRLENLVEETNVNTTQDRIAFIIHRHVSIIKFSLKIDKLLREICLIEVVASTINICMLEYYCLLVKNYNSILKFQGTVKITECSDLKNVFKCLKGESSVQEWRNGNKLAVITYGIVLVSMVFNILIYCYVGELLKEKCEEIGKAAYMIEWYKLSGKEGLALIMIIIMSNNPRKLTAGQIIELSVATFCNIVKSSFAYLGILQALADQ